MKILIMAYTYPPYVGGVEKLISELADAYEPSLIHVLAGSTNHQAEEEWDARAKYRITRTVLEPDNLLQRLRMKMDVMAFGQVRGFYHNCYRRSIGQARSLVKQFNPDTLLCSWSYLLEAEVALKSAGRKAVAIAHGQDVLEAIGNDYVCDLWRSVDRILANSNYTKERLIEIGVDPARIGLTLLGIDPTIAERPCRRPDIQGLKLEAKKIVLTMCRLVPHKGTDRLIEAMNIVKKEFPNAVLVVAGDGYYRGELERMRASLALKDNVIFIGMVNDAEKWGWYAACDIFAMPSRWDEPTWGIEGFGYAFLEASAFGKPVVAGNSGGIPDAVNNGVTGILVDPNDPKDIADAIISLLKEPDKARDMGQAGIRWVENERNIKTSIENMIKEISAPS